MAGDWIKMTTNLHECPEVIQLAGILAKNRFDIVGRLHRVWSWYDAHTSDGHAKGVTGVTVDELSGCDGFGTAMVTVGWLEELAGDLVMVKFDRHNGESAKKRAEATERKRMSRKRCDNGHTNPVTETRPEKRREEKSNKRDTPLPPTASAPVTLEQAVAYAPMVRMTPEQAALWWHTRNGSGWTKGAAGGGTARKITSWQSDMATSLRWVGEECDKRKTGKHNGCAEDVSAMAEKVEIYTPRKK